MKEQLPSPEFNSDLYERPNQDWICGKAADGKACRIGPDAKGRCRATCECRPALELQEGETKGRYKCTRPAEHGGPCGEGPLPDGTCSRPITRCAPVRSLRARRRLLTISVIAFTIGVLLVALYGSFRSDFINPGQISSQHSTATFARLAGAKGNDPDGCMACHEHADAGPRGLAMAALNAEPGPFHVGLLASIEPPAMGPIDQNCQACHQAHSFHQPNVLRDHSCSACHREHQGSGLMPPPTDANCLSCHANAEVMQASFEQGKKLPPEAFDFRPDQGRALFKAPRPEQGYTKLIHGFAEDHPEFQIVAERLGDPNRLKFNHELHLSSPNVPAVNGRKLQCADCHKPDAAGVYYLKISYAQNCQSCHSLQFDVHNPDLLIPHGSAQHVRAFLRNLPEQYSEHATRKGMTGGREREQFVQTAMSQLRQDFGSGEALEQRVFFSDARSGPIARIGQGDATGAARFPGCAYCHEVKTAGNDAPEVSVPVIPDRWFIRGRFDHGKHFKVACIACHDAPHSRETSDILLPTKQSCVECHSPKGGVAHTCATCHTFHSARK